MEGSRVVGSRTSFSLQHISVRHKQARCVGVGPRWDACAAIADRAYGSLPVMLNAIVAGGYMTIAWLGGRVRRPGYISNRCFPLACALNQQQQDSDRHPGCNRSTTGYRYVPRRARQTAVRKVQRVCFVPWTGRVRQPVVIYGVSISSRVHNVLDELD